MNCSESEHWQPHIKVMKPKEVKLFKECHTEILLSSSFERGDLREAFRLKIKDSENAWSKDNCYLGAVCLNFFWLTDHEFGMEHAFLKCLKRKQVLVAK